MGISRLFLKEILEICNFSYKNKDHLSSKCNILFLGDQSIRVTIQQINNSFFRNYKDKRIYKDQNAKLDDFFPKISKKELVINTLDINGNPTIKADITNENELIKKSITKESISHFIDIGTLEHVFDPYKAMENISRIIKDGGLISHLSPCSSYLNHGYYCISPQLFNDFYLSRGYNILRFRTISYIGNYDSFFSICFNLNYDHNAELEGLRKTIRKRKWKTFINSFFRRILMRFCRETYISFTAKKITKNKVKDNLLFQSQYEIN